MTTACRTRQRHRRLRMARWHPDRPRACGARLRVTMGALGGGISRDPIAERGGLNLYGFARNNPVSFCDYLGLAAKKTCTEAIGKNGKPRIIFTVSTPKGGWKIVHIDFAADYVGYASGGMVYDVTAKWEAEVAVLCKCDNCYETLTGTRQFKNTISPPLGLDGWPAYDVSNVPQGFPGVPIVTSIAQGIGELLASSVADVLLNSSLVLMQSDMNSILDQIKSGKPTDPTQGGWKGGVSPCSK